MANHIYINTDLKDLTANAVANINRPTQVVRLPQIIEGEVVDVVLHLVKSDGQYDARSGSVEVVEVAVSAKGKAATSGTFRLNAGLEITGALTWNASAEAVAGALNALNGGTGAYGSQVSVAKLANGVYRVIFNDAGVRVDMAGQSLDLAPESTIGISTSVVGSGSIRAQQVIEISQQPAIYSETWASVGSTWTGQLDANTSRVQEMIAGAAEAFFEIKVGSDVVCQIPISILPSVAAPNSFPAHTLPDNLDAFAANPTTNGFFSPANWRDDLSLVVGEDVQAWSTNLDEVAARMSWNNQEKTFDIVTGSSNVTIQVGQEVLMYARNTSGLQMTDGQVVKVVGSQGNNPTIALAQADTVENASGVIGVVTQVIDNNSNGFVSLIGKVRDLTLDSGTFTEGDLLYLSSTVAGGLTLVRPDIGVEIGRVIATSNGGNNAGIIEVNINNDSSVHELEQQLLILINDNTAAIAAKIPNDSTTGTPSAATFLRGDNAWASLTGGGDMLKSVYDPNLYVADAFSMGNMDETATAKILTNTERSEIAANTSKVGITPTQASDITTNNAKVGITTAQAADITTNNAKVGITTGQAADIVTNNAKVTNANHTGDVTGSTALTIAVDAVDIPMLSATGTPDGTTFLRGDNVWATPAGGGDVATDAIWDAKGDLAGGTGANAAARLAIGTDGQVLTADSLEVTGMKWAAGGGGTVPDASDTVAGIVQQATEDQFLAGTQTGTAGTLVPSNEYAALLPAHQGNIQIDLGRGYTEAQSGAVDINRQFQASNAWMNMLQFLTVGSANTDYCTLTNNTGLQFPYNNNVSYGQVDWTTKIAISFQLGQYDETHFGLDGAILQIGIGRQYNTNRGDMTIKGFGFKIVGVNIYGVTHNGTTLTTTSSIGSYTGNRTYKYLLAINDGSTGTTSWYINGALAGTSAAGDGASSGTSANVFRANLEDGQGTKPRSEIIQWYFSNPIITQINS